MTLHKHRTGVDWLNFTIMLAASQFGNHVVVTGPFFYIWVCFLCAQDVWVSIFRSQILGLCAAWLWGLVDIKNHNLHREYNFKGEFRYLKT